MIKKGSKIKCGRCEEEIYVAAQDIPFGAGMRSELLNHIDGRPVEPMSPTRCPACNQLFLSISTRTARTF